MAATTTDVRGGPEVTTRHSASGRATTGRTATGEEPTSRGTTTIPSDVVAKIAAQVASECPHIGAAAGGVLGVGARRDFGSRPTATCDLYGRKAVLRLDVGVDFPTPLRSTVQTLREQVTSRVEHLTGLEVSRVDVDISWLNPANEGRRQLR
ncbi:putative alkaline shock family protein YloU [Knoellia remsis]|uniref:Putative alkaline shock family protein YloU n=1 Tax=Knoellia remsis TaxID=407159 RepID=A0A2T0UK41_9MICO|nr:Asp23/Gls24 family envelope stress response protein [Knoellia remsis]PRY58218.1 putative alkaline shock family protein YloU [Knoellia remsis]